MNRLLLASAAIASAALLALPSVAEVPKSTRHHRLAVKSAPSPSRAAQARDWSAASRNLGNSVVAIATPAKDDPAALPNHRCTGVLISRQHVLASGYCVSNGDDEAATLAAAEFEVYVGWRIDAASKPVKVAAVMRHPDYDPLTFRSDLVVLKLANPLPQGVEPLAITTDAEAEWKPSANVGWMKDDSGEKQALMRMSVPPVKHDRCEAVLREQRLQTAQGNFVGLASDMMVPPDAALAAWKTLTKSMPSLLGKDMLCAGPVDGMPCDADSGSLLLTMPASGQPQIIGVFSNLPVCETPGIPAVYTRAAPYAAWINDMVKK